MPLLCPDIVVIESGEARAIVLCGPERHLLWPDIPTAEEQGFPDLSEKTFVGQNLYAFPPGSPGLSFG